MKFFADKGSIVSWITVPEHLCGWNNIVHGGIISTICDEIMSWAGIYFLKQITLTKSVTIDFIKAIFVNNELRVEGKIIDRNRKREAIIEGTIYNHKEQLCTKSIGTFALLSPEVAKRMRIISDKNIKSFFEPLMRA
jgi:acyl-coenzyme A thioesterase PaaI-like protein